MLKEETKIKMPYGNKAEFNKSDGVWKFRDKESGLWRRYMTVLDKDGNPKKGFGSDGVIIGEGKDMHFNTNNGHKVFMCPKKD